MKLSYTILFFVLCLILSIIGIVTENLLARYIVVFGFGVVVGSFAVFMEFLNQKDALFERVIREDEMKFGMVVIEFYRHDPVLTTGVWKKVHPKIIPPWHQSVFHQSKEQ